jgi:SAM-dependent methyltransferase
MKTNRSDTIEAAYRRLQSLPPGIKQPLKDARRWLESRLYAGEGYACPICGRAWRSFAPAGTRLGMKIKCAHCLSTRRHRFLYAYLLKEWAHLFPEADKRLLHIAPQPEIGARLRERLGGGYVSGDLFREAVGVRLDICAPPLHAGVFDGIVCSHVLEHVEEDGKALRAFWRVLKPGGWAMLLVPIQAGPTFEDARITDAAGRRRYFGQHNHVRFYGEDFAARVEAQGFRVREVQSEAAFTDEEIRRWGIEEQALFLCTKVG